MLKAGVTWVADRLRKVKAQTANATACCRFNSI